ncbi:M14 family zinc carboxypeptidase [Solirubrobacter ginsenosidimutans]|uniref:Zinc carboxypeptidase n=1 Tax=Solirubrobacter ginsenosidimutans TaxID=490573 RepID=A0A9X3N0E9_9ACTN|nr:M14 family metallopeptidase [Solirubrobacter ginsenosidimutans]MDA0166134.1 M14 family zinc carboxypeptidase [Solirubrobacter ginsenosidimutans]
MSVLATVLVSATTAVAAPAPQLDVYVGDVQRDALGKLVDLGVDRSEIDLSAAKAGAKGAVHVETILSGEQAQELADQGVTMTPKEIDGQTVTQRATAKAAAGLNVFKKYGGPGGIKEEYAQVARRHPLITKLVTIGKTTNGQDIIALKVSLGAPLLKDGAKPSTLYMSAQHAREWITPEMNRRLMHYYVDGYLHNRQVTNLINTTELWFVPVSNPDGYDFTFEPGQRLWRKNLRDNDGNGVIEPGDGVDPNRNYAYKWGYDNEGSSDDPASETFRGPGPNSEPESKAMDNLFKRVGGFTEFINYHSAAELILYGVGWQVNTPTPDDLLGIAMSGDDAHPAIPGYDPDISAELYTTNGEVDSYFTEKYGSFGFTPEMSTCTDAANSVPDDQWLAKDCGSDFDFPDDEKLIQAEFEKNIPFALATAESAKDPDDPVSAVGRKAPDFEVDSFDVSYGDPQTVAVTAKRAIKHLQLNYKINNGKTKTANVSEWKGGEKYGGDENAHYYAEFRGEVKGTRVGDKVKVWFSGEKKDGWRDDDVSSAAFTYTVKGMGAKVLVIADEDRNGVNPTFPSPPGGGLQYGQLHLDAVRAAGYSADLWNTDTQGVPHDLGVLSHYKAIVWYMGDNRITQDPEDFFTDTPFGPLPDVSVAEREQYLTIAVRDFLNEGGKLINAAETAQFSGLPGITDVVGGLYYGLNGAPDQECVVTSIQGLFDECLLLADDFRQYWLGGFSRFSLGGPNIVDGIAKPINGYHANLAGTPSNDLDEAGVFQPTSEVLPVAEFPQFKSQGAASYNFTGSPFSPVEGTKYAGAVHQDSSYFRLTKTIAVPAAATTAQLQFQLSYNTEPSYDNVIVEAHTVGADDWTTLKEASGKTQTSPPAECTANPDGFLLQLHPFLKHYLGGTNSCAQPGSTGTWNSFTGSSGGWIPVTFDLSAYKGKSVEVSISYVTDPGGGGVGAFVDDTKVVIDGTTTADGFEGATSTWTPAPAPPGSPQNAGAWEIAGQLVNFFAGTSTDDTLLLGFGLEQVAAPADRTKLVKQALGGLGVR